MTSCVRQCACFFIFEVGRELCWYRQKGAHVKKFQVPPVSNDYKLGFYRSNYTSNELFEQQQVKLNTSIILKIMASPQIFIRVNENHLRLWESNSPYTATISSFSANVSASRQSRACRDRCRDRRDIARLHTSSL